MDITSPFLILGRWSVMLGTDDICLGDLNSASSHTEVATVVGCGAPHTMHQLLIVLHDRVPDIVTGTGVTGMVWAH